MGVKIFNIKNNRLDKADHKNEEFNNKYYEYAKYSKEDILNVLNTSTEGISNNEAYIRINKNGRNIVVENKKKPWYYFLIKSFMDQFIIVLILLGTVSLFLDDTLGAIIIYILAVISAFIRFMQEYSAHVIDTKLKNMIKSTTDIKRKDNESITEINIEELVEGDIIELGAGSIIPADLRVLECKDLFISQSIFTGESVPVEKYSTNTRDDLGVIYLDNICYMGSNVVSGSASCVVIKTGKSTYLGNIASQIGEEKEVTNFEVGISKITKLIIRYMAVIVIFVFIINGMVKQDWLQSLLFAISVAVGITPGMLSMIINVNLSKGSKTLASKKTVVKNINSIQNLGAIDVLCTDKTGTLTIDKVVLQKYMNVDGEEDLKVLDYAFLNSYYSTGIKNLIDRAIIEYGVEHKVKEETSGYKKIDEIPFDYNRKKMSIVVETPTGKHRLITKGALEEILKICTSVRQNDNVVSLTAEMISKINENADKLHSQGMHVIAICEKLEYPGENIFNSEDEQEMTFIGYIAFLDPPKPDVKESLEELAKAGITVKVLTGDSAAVTKNICSQVGISYNNVLTGADIDKLTDDELKIEIENTNIFSRLAPLQKERVVHLLRQNGHVVGYMGDGVNDAPSLRAADIGISVDTATDIAKESSDIILLEKSLMVLKDGVIEGRRIYGNIMKYLKMTLSANFGNVFSVLVGSIFLPFLPMIPIQIIIQSLIYDLSQIAIPFDTVDEEFLEKPKKWDTKDLKHFMNTLGITSSVFDVATFLVLWFVLGFNSVDKQIYFQTGWFIEGLISQTLIVHFIRTSKIPFIESIANKGLLITTSLSVVFAIGAQYIFREVREFNFAVVPNNYYLYLIAILFTYFLAVQIVKKLYIKKYGNWL
ncbi:MAG: magnesium-translocating P-type ATPase [Clostridia bacterium]|nr:magnesium-translocating P-type ATPase [Clostridia bacterium]